MLAAAFTIRYTTAMAEGQRNGWWNPSEGNDTGGVGEDPSGELHADSYLVILYLLMFLFLLGIVGYGVCCGIPVFCAKYCRCTSTSRACGIPCFRIRFDMSAYRQERETLQRLRDIRRIQRQQYMDALRVAASQPQGMGVDVTQFNATPNNITMLSAGQRSGAAGLVTSPWAPAELELRRLAYIHAQGGQMASVSDRQEAPQFTDRASMWAAFHQMNSTGLIIVPQDTMGGQDDDVPYRETLSSEERRAALREMLEFTPYRSAQKSQVEDDSSPKDEPSIRADDEANIDEGHIAEVEEEKVAPSDENTNGTNVDLELNGPRSVAFPAHEAPELAEVTCAICLDDFDEGDMLNSVEQTKCCHRFHQDCLIMWLEHHDVCPICRRVMVTDSDWRATNNVRGADSA